MAFVNILREYFNPNSEFCTQIHSVRFETLLTAPLKPQVKINDRIKKLRVGVILG